MPILTPEFRVSWPNVFKAKHNKLNGKDEFTVTALFKKGEDLSALKAAAEEALFEQFGRDKSKWPKNLRTPFRDQAEKAKEVDGKQVLPDGHEEGAIFLNLKSMQKPGVVDQNVQEIIDSSQFYPGCYARATVSVYAYDQAGNRGVNFGLGNIQKTRDGEPFGNRTTPEMDFAPVAGGNSSAESSTDLFS